MKISIATTWNNSCGISEYSRNLANAFISLGHEVEILGSTVFPNIQEDEPFVYRLGKPHKPDILHLQYSSYIFTREYYDAILASAVEQGAHCFATFHDQHLYPGFDYDMLSGAMAHRDEIFQHLPKDLPKFVIPFGVPTTKIRIASFGLGRNMNDAIQQVCDELGYELRISDWRGWKSQEELMEFVKSCDATVLWYPENNHAGSSSTARLAIGARRPLYVNDVTWFKDLKCCEGVNIFYSKENLKEHLLNTFSNTEIEYHNWKEVAKKHLEIYSCYQS